MLKIIVASAATLSLASLGGCASFSSISSGTAPTVAEIQQDAVSVCGFLPTAETVTDLVTKTNAEAAAGEALGSTIANIICAAVTKKSAKYRLAYVPVADGVAIKGKFVR